MAALTGTSGSLFRCLALQAAWSYERMQGVGMAWASAPVLRRLFEAQPDRYRAAVGRSAGFFNANPFLAPTAVGAFLRAESDDEPPAQIERLRTVLSGPLGALGDRLYWTGLVPTMVALTLSAVTLGAGFWPVPALLLIHNGTRLWLGHWLLQLGWTHGQAVGTAMTASFLPRLAAAAGISATVSGAAAPLLVAAGALDGAAGLDVALVVGTVITALACRWFFGRQASALKFTLAAAVVAALWHLGRS